MHKISEYLDEFFMMYISPYYNESTLFTHRKQIRDSKYLNKLLYDNMEGLQLIYELYKNETNMFTL